MRHAPAQFRHFSTVVSRSLLVKLYPVRGHCDAYKYQPDILVFLNPDAKCYVSHTHSKGFIIAYVITIVNILLQ